MDVKLVVVLGVALIVAVANSQKSCPENQVYNECGTFCPITCANKDNPPLICPLVCMAGCFCIDGYYKDANGNCVTEEGCSSSQATEPPTQVCPNNQIYSTCGSACPLTCANKDSPPPCVEMCVEECTCPQGMVSTDSGVCVTPDNCPTTTTEPPTQVCPNNQVFSTCGSACPLTCENKDSPSPCVEVCVAECTCPSGMVATNDGICVAPEDCPATTPESCQLPPESGLCEAYMPSYFYNSTAGNCHIFIYGGCQGNDNRYDSYQECMDACSSVEVGLPTVDALYTTKDTCPSDVSETCEESCSTKDDCSSAELCCSNGCGHLCAESTPLPYYSPPMSCPAIDPLLGIFCTLDFGCKGHDECSSGELCCPTGCGSACRTAVIQTPYCAEVNAQVSSSGLLGAFVPQCDSKGNFSLVQCHEGQCWCVDPATGIPTATPPTMFSVPDCGQSTCEYNGETYLEGQSFPSIDGCNNCFCAGEVVGCTEMACLPKNCEYNGQVYDDGTSFLASDGCNTCNCHNGVAACTEKACLCQIGGLEVTAGSPLDIGCAVCDCIWATQRINCSPKDDDSCVPIKQTKRVSMKFTGDYDSIDDMDEFEEAVENSLVAQYGTTMGLKNEQITDIEATRGSIVIAVTVQDVDEGANVTLLVVRMHNDYNNKSITIIYQELILTPPDNSDDSDFSVEDGDDDDDHDEDVQILLIASSVVVAMTLALSMCVVILIVVIIRMRHKNTPFAPLKNAQSCAIIDEDGDFELKADLSKSDKA